MTLKFTIGDKVIELDEAQARQLHAELNILFVDDEPIAPRTPWITETWAP